MNWRERPDAEKERIELEIRSLFPGHTDLPPSATRDAFISLYYRFFSR
jgi:hypothetical protein